MKPTIRKTVTFIETTYIEGGRAPDLPVEMAGVAAVIQNPWVGRGFVENLRPEILAMAPVLGDLLVPLLLEQLGGGDRIEAYGKAAIVGLNGEIEHASGIIHTLRFGNKFREWCDEAGLRHCSAHGLRKAAATRLAEHGAQGAALGRDGVQLRA